MCHLELEPFGPGWRRAARRTRTPGRAARLWPSGRWGGGRGEGRYQALATGPDKIQPVKQSSHWGLGDQLDKTICMHLWTTGVHFISGTVVLAVLCFSFFFPFFLCAMLEWGISQRLVWTWSHWQIGFLSKWHWVLHRFYFQKCRTKKEETCSSITLLH